MSAFADEKSHRTRTSAGRVSGYRPDEFTVQDEMKWNLSR